VALTALRLCAARFRRCSTLSGGTQAWKEEKAAGGDGRVFFLDAETGAQDAAAAAADDT
jgi:hypothetical protein